MRLSVYNVDSQVAALKKLARMAAESTVHPEIRKAALNITNDCKSRDESCELESIFNAVKYGHDAVEGFKKGLRYVADPLWADFFTAPHRILRLCAEGSCGGDCDDHCGLIVALCGSIGYTMGLRMYGEKKDVYTHVYAVAKTPKRFPKKIVGLDTTVPDSFVGWEPPSGYVLTAWLESGD